MASNFVVKVHPVVHLIIVDSYERRAKPLNDRQKEHNNKALGTLLGYYEKNAVQITNAFAIPFDESKEEPELDDTFNADMIAMLRRSAPNEQPVGWFYTNSDLSPATMAYHDYYARIIADGTKKDAPPTVLLTLDTTFSKDVTPEAERFRMPVRAYVRMKAGIPGAREPHCAIFKPVRVELDAYPGEAVALQLIKRGVGNKTREINLENGLQRLEETTHQLIEWLETLDKHVSEVLSRAERAEDATLGRKLSQIVSAASVHLQADHLDQLINNSLRDYMMISYLSNLAKTQLAVNEKLISQ